MSAITACANRKIFAADMENDSRSLCSPCPGLLQAALRKTPIVLDRLAAKHQN
jgi:hypothetical protein